MEKHTYKRRWTISDINCQQCGLPSHDPIHNTEREPTNMKKVQVHYHNMFGAESDKGNNGEREYEIEIPSNGNIEEDRETVFRMMNHVDGTEEQLLALNGGKSDRSMSVGDSVTIDGRTFRCESAGWTERDAEGDVIPEVKELPRVEVPENELHETIPADYEVRPLPKGEEPKGKATCGHCQLSWDDSIGTSMTPAPSARCPFEYFHKYPEDNKRSVSHTILDDGQHRIKITSPRLECDCLMIVFTDEGIVIDAVTGGVVEATQSKMYESIEEELEPQ
jgi:hypothetical protein